MIEKKCTECGGTDFRVAHDEWMKRTFRFVENGVLNLCENCGSKFLVCKQCGGLFTRVHPALEQWEVNQKCPSCGFEDPKVKAWDGVSAL